MLLYLVVWWATVTPTPALQNKSDVDDVAAQLGPMLRPGDQVVSTQPEQIPVIYYYLPNAPFAALRRHHGPGGRPAGHGLARRAGPAEGVAGGHAFEPVLDRMPVGRRLLLVSPITENPRSWRAPWTELVRRRGAQYGGALQADRRFHCTAHAPLFYRYSPRWACGVLYQKVSA